VDCADPQTLSRIQPILEGESCIVTENEGEEILKHKNFRLFATGNTKGRGDLDNTFAGTNFLNASFLDRYSIFEMTYTKKESEIINLVLDDVDLSDKLVALFSLLRQASEEGILVNCSFSTRRLQDVAASLRAGDSLKEALDFDLTKRYEADEQKIIVQMIQDVFEASVYIKKKWTLGMEHSVALVAVSPTDSVTQ